MKTAFKLISSLPNLFPSDFVVVITALINGLKEKKKICNLLFTHQNRVSSAFFSDLYRASNPSHFHATIKLIVYTQSSLQNSPPQIP